MKWRSKIILVLNVLLVLATFCAYFAPKIDPHQFWIFSFFGLFYPIFVIANLVFVCYWLFVDMKYSLVSILAILVGWSNIGSYIGYNTDKISNNPHDISIISFNIGNALEAYDKKADVKEDKQNKMNRFLSRFDDEDIICLQEVGNYATDVINKKFKPYNIYKTDKGAVILSKHKIIKKGVIEFGTKTNSCLWADLLVGVDTLRIYNVHLRSNNITKDANEMVESDGSIKKEGFKNRVLRIFRKYKNYHQARTVQARTVKEHANGSPHPVVICGDFNDVPVSFTYELMKENLNDAFKEKGEGLGSTFNGKIPFLRIDYILADPSLNIVKFNVIKEIYSDHYPVAALVSLRKV
jgi:endonuclease/exonuclease/phosphatase family metal-dependent hydrolase